LEDEGWFCGLQNRPDYQNCEQHDEREDHYTPEYAFQQLVLLSLVVVALLHRHGCSG